MMKTLHEVVMDEIINQRLTIRQFKKVANFNDTTLYNIQRTKPQLKTYYKISDFTGIPVQELMKLPIKHEQKGKNE